MGYGLIVKDFSGKVFAAACFTTFSVLDPVVVEASAALREFCHTRRFFKIIVEGDSLQVVKALNHKRVVWTMYGQIVEDIKMVLRNCEY
jgi:hypothetical protein